MIQFSGSHSVTALTFHKLLMLMHSATHEDILGGTRVEMLSRLLIATRLAEKSIMDVVILLMDDYQFGQILNTKLTDYTSEMSVEICQVCFV